MPLAQQAVAFAQQLRQRGVPVVTQNCISYLDAIQSLSAAGASSRPSNDLYWAGRLTLLTKPTQIETYDSVFAQFWADETHDLAQTLTQTELIALAFDTDDPDSPPPPEPEPDPTPDAPQIRQVSIRYSPEEILRPPAARDTDFTQLSAAELARINRLIDQIPAGGPTKLSRRLKPTAKPAASRSQLDLRQTVRHAMRTHGEIVKWHRQTRRPRLRNLVFLLDVSGSMALYAQALLRFAHATSRARHKTEVFAVGTRLTRITRELSARQPETALAAAAESVLDWQGGTRLGDTLATFNDRWGVPGLARGAVVVILSDGWDRGKPDQIDRQMLRLSRVAYKIIWVNPLKATPGYAPLAQGMAAALPHVDSFVEGHCLSALEELAALLAGGGS